jgi:hypothetical protein
MPSIVGAIRAPVRYGSGLNPSCYTSAQSISHIPSRDLPSFCHPQESGPVVHTPVPVWCQHLSCDFRRLSPLLELLRGRDSTWQPRSCLLGRRIHSRLCSGQRLGHPVEVRPLPKRIPIGPSCMHKAGNPSRGIEPVFPTHLSDSQLRDSQLRALASQTVKPTRCRLSS